MTLPLTLTPNPNQVAYLLQHGADAELRDKDGHAPEDLVRGANPNAPADGIDAAAAAGGWLDTSPVAAPGGELARAALLGALCDPTLLLLSKATSAN